MARANIFRYRHNLIIPIFSSIPLSGFYLFFIQLRTYKNLNGESRTRESTLFIKLCASTPETIFIQIKENFVRANSCSGYPLFCFSFSHFFFLLFFSIFLYIFVLFSVELKVFFICVLYAAAHIVLLRSYGSNSVFTQVYR